MIRSLILFSIFKQHFWDVNNRIKKLGAEPFLVPFWKEVNKQMTKSLRPKPSVDFLNIPEIKNTMFVSPSSEWLKAEESYVKKYSGAERLLKEDGIGKPSLIKINGVSTSTNTLHHLYHMYRFQKDSSVKLASIKSVVEWGGGYGNMAKLWKRTNPDVTYTIVDSALFTSIQWLYLSSVLGPGSVNLLDRAESKIVKGKINLIPLALLDKTTLEADLFVSTWGLSESSEAAQDYVINKKWFGASHFLLGFQKSTKALPTASRLGQLSKKDGATIHEIEFIPGNYYGFK